ncbi:MAG TPA: aldose epimerase family protein [Longimicrobium sp.]|nr:aldose epimerase family protein [Longimicrobium sp.]
MASSGAQQGAGIERTLFGHLPDGTAVERFALRGASGLQMEVSGYGGAILALRTPDREGRLGDVVLGFDRLDDYVADQAYFGALIGRYANRIRGGRFSLEGREYALPVNDGGNHLHGGPGGFHKVPWAAEPFQENGTVGVRLSRVSPDGEQGYPGTLLVTVTYRLTLEGALVIDYAAETDQPTPVSLTQHTYFNLSGDPARDVLGHEVELHADRFTPADGGLIPTGELAPVAGTPFDFRRPTAIGARIDDGDARLSGVGGYDHNFAVTDGGATLAPAARVHEPVSGRVLELFTTEPGLQFYSGNYLDGSAVGKDGQPYRYRCGFCLEPQKFPDSPNHPDFPTCILRPGERYASRSVYRFSVE